jgi:NADH-quinone oxidoreductase subunit L
VLVDSIYTWIGAGIGDTRLAAEVAFRLDPLSAVMILVVTGVGFLIHVYSVGYMDDDHRSATWTTTIGTIGGSSASSAT